MNDTLRTTAGILLVTVPAIAFGGTFLLRVAAGAVPATDQQKAFFRAGHAHAGVLVLFSLVALLYLDAAPVTGTPRSVASALIPLAPILIPAGFFFSMIGAGRTQPNRLVALIYAGGACLAIGTLTLGIALLGAGDPGA